METALSTRDWVWTIDAGVWTTTFQLAGHEAELVTRKVYPEIPEDQDDEVEVYVDFVSRLTYKGQTYEGRSGVRHMSYVRALMKTGEPFYFR